MATRITNAWLFHLFMKHVKTILFTGILFASVAFGVSVLMPKTYVSSGLVYANHSNDMKDVALVRAFGAEYQADKLVQLFRSQAMEQMLISKFDLTTYYEMDTTAINWRRDLQVKIVRDFKAERNEFLTVEISAKSKSPEMAAAVVNTMINYVDTIRRDVFNANLHLYVNELADRVAQKNEEVQLNLNAIFEYTANKPVNNVLRTQKQKAIKERKQHANFVPGDAVVEEALKTNYSVELEQMVDAYYLELGRYNTLKAELNVAQQKLNMPFPGVYKIRMAMPNYSAVSPNKKVIVVLGFILGVFGAFVWLVARVRYEDLVAK